MLLISRLCFFKNSSLPVSSSEKIQMWFLQNVVFISEPRRFHRVFFCDCHSSNEEFVPEILVLLPRLCRNFMLGLTGFVWERFGNWFRGLLALCSFFFCRVFSQERRRCVETMGNKMLAGLYNWLVWFVHCIWNSFWCTMCPKCLLSWRRCFGQFFCWYELFMNCRADIQKWSLPKILAQLLQHTIQEINAVIIINIGPKTTCALSSQMIKGLKGHAFSVEFLKSLYRLRPTCKRIEKHLAKRWQN